MSDGAKQDEGVVSRAKRLLATVQRSRPYRANQRLGEARGNILAAGIAFFGVFSIFPLLALGVTVLAQVARLNPQLQQRAFDYLEQSLPGLLREQGETEGGIVTRQQLLDTALDPTTLGLSALISVVTLLFTALGWIAALREGIRSVFRMPPLQLDPVRAKLRDLAVVMTLGVLLIASAAVSVVANAATRTVLRLVGLDDSVVAQGITLALVFVSALAVDALLFMVLYRVLAGAERPYRGLITGAVLAAVGVGVLRLLVGRLLGGVGGDFGFLSAFVPILALFVWLNLTARVMLYGASWSAVGRRPEPDPVEAVEQLPGPREPLPMSDAERARAVLPVRWVDRTVLAAGVVLGAAGLMVVRVSGSAVRAAGGGVARLVRGD